MDEAGYHCSCPDHELRRVKCKHAFAVELALNRETAPDGALTEARAVRATYAQDWSAYNAAQTTEKEHFCRLLRDLCAGIPDSSPSRGRPRLPLSDMLFAVAFKVYSTVSARRFMTDLRAACADGYLQGTPHYNSIFNYLESETLTPIIRELITASSLPLSAVETSFAIDSTGFGMSKFFRYYNARYKHEQIGRDWLKLHAIVGVKTNIVTSVEVTGRDSHDSPQFAPLVQATAQHFQISEVSADKAYTSRDSLTLVESLGGMPYIPFKVWARGDTNHALWNKLFHFFSLHREEFLAHYHKRSNVESAFSAIKRVFGDAVRSRTPVAQVNEVLLKVVCHNLRCLIHEAHELEITPMLERFVCPKSPTVAQQLPAM